MSRSIVVAVQAIEASSWKRYTVKWGMLMFSASLLVSVYVSRLLNGGIVDSSAMGHHPRYIVKAVVMPSRIEQANDHLKSEFPEINMVRAFEKDNADLSLMESAMLLDRKWDKDGKMREIYSVTYPKAGEVSCTLSHRRVLESFLLTDEETMLVLEDDAIGLTDHISREIEEVLNVAPSRWDYINLGRCWDICDSRRKQVAGTFNVTNASGHASRGTLERSQGWEMCTHAYLITRAGAEKLLQYTQPILLPYDHTVNMLGRQGVLDIYFTSPRLFVQSEETDSLLRTKEDSLKPVCDPNGERRAEVLETEVPSYDRYLMSRISQSPVQNMVSIGTHVLQEATTSKDAEKGRVHQMADLCSRGSDEFCVRSTQVHREIEQHCSIHGGGQATGAVDSASLEFLDELDSAGLDGVIVWGIRPEESHSHRFVHEAIYKAAKFALDQSPVPRHLCYVRETPGFDLGTVLYGDSSRGKLARSLVFTSPKHMTWSHDMGFLTLPIEETSLYVFHGMTPRPHETLKKIGRAAEWETWGPDGHVPLLDSQEFVRGDVWRPHSGCTLDDRGKHFECASERLVVMPWASKYLPDEIAENKQRVKEESMTSMDEQRGMHFVGTIWDCNLQEFVDFTRGCLKENVTVTRHGKWMLSSSIETLTELPNFETVDDLDENTVEEVFRDSQSIYAPAFQGSCHLDSISGQSYIADRILNVISMGMFPLTNNPAAIEFLGNSSAIVFREDEEKLCHAAGSHVPDATELASLMDLVAREHTYLSRLSSMMRFFLGPLNAVETPKRESTEARSGVLTDLEAETWQTRDEEEIVPSENGFRKEALHAFDFEIEGSLEERDLQDITSTIGEMPTIAPTPNKPGDEGEGSNKPPRTRKPRTPRTRKPKTPRTRRPRTPRTRKPRTPRTRRPRTPRTRRPRTPRTRRPRDRRPKRPRPRPRPRPKPRPKDRRPRPKKPRKPKKKIKCKYLKNGKKVCTKRSRGESSSSDETPKDKRTKKPKPPKCVNGINQKNGKPCRDPDCKQGRNIKTGELCKQPRPDDCVNGINVKTGKLCRDPYCKRGVDIRTGLPCKQPKPDKCVDGRNIRNGKPCQSKDERTPKPTRAPRTRAPKTPRPRPVPVPDSKNPGSGRPKPKPPTPKKASGWYGPWNPKPPSRPKTPADARPRPPKTPDRRPGKPSRRPPSQPDRRGKGGGKGGYPLYDSGKGGKGGKGGKRGGGKGGYSSQRGYSNASLYDGGKGGGKGGKRGSYNYGVAGKGGSSPRYDNRGGGKGGKGGNSWFPDFKRPSWSYGGHADVRPKADMKSYTKKAPGGAPRPKVAGDSKPRPHSAPRPKVAGDKKYPFARISSDCDSSDERKYGKSWKKDHWWNLRRKLFSR